jgi:hypothetical protein
MNRSPAIRGFEAASECKYSVPAKRAAAGKFGNKEHLVQQMREINLRRGTCDNLESRMSAIARRRTPLENEEVDEVVFR